jgi:CPA1 family monovalent cation:H+ antiporter
VLPELAFILAAVAVISLIEILAEKSRLPAAALLTIAGLCYALLPGPNLVLNPEFILTFILPPLLYSAALNSSLLAIRRNLRPVISLSVVLVLVTAVVVGVSTDLLIPGVTLAAGIALGAAVAPPDPVAALAIGRRAGLPPRLITLIEGEGLLNDATALTLFTVAAVAATSGDFSPGGTVLRFVLAAAGGIAVGAVTAGAVRLLRRFVHGPIVLNSLSLATPFAAYLLGQEAHVSGVLAVVVTGLIVGHDTPRRSSGASRLQTAAVWRLADFLLEGFVFLLIGQQLPAVIRGLRNYPSATILAAGCLTVGLVIVLRPAWLIGTQALPRRLRLRLGARDRDDQRRLSAPEVAVMSWAGTRGVISLAAIFSLPVATAAGRPFPDRDLLIFCTYLVVLVTLLGQGLTFAPLARALGLRADFADQARTRNEARTAAVTAALRRLDELAAEDDADSDVLDVSPEVIAELRAGLERRAARYRQRLDQLDQLEDEDGDAALPPGYLAAIEARRAVIDAQREELLRWRDAGRLPDASLRVLQHELDLEENSLRPPEAR